MFTLLLRTRDDLMKLLSNGKSPAWKIAASREPFISKVRIYNWEGTLVLEGEYDPTSSERTEDGTRLIVGFKNAQINRCQPPFKWSGQNPVNYLKEGNVDRVKEDPSESMGQPSTKVNDESESTKNDERRQKSPPQKKIKQQEKEDHIRRVEEESRTNTSVLVYDTSLSERSLAACTDLIYMALSHTYDQEDIRIIYFNKGEDTQDGLPIDVLFRVRYSGHYIFANIVISQERYADGNRKVKSNHFFHPKYLSFLSSEDKAKNRRLMNYWLELTRECTPQEWEILDYLMATVHIYQADLMWLEPSEIGEEAADEAMDKYGFYIPNDDLLPVIFCQRESVSITIFPKSPKGFGADSIVIDNHKNAHQPISDFQKAVFEFISTLSKYYKPVEKEFRLVDIALNRWKGTYSPTSSTGIKDKEATDQSKEGNDEKATQNAAKSGYHQLDILVYPEPKNEKGAQTLNVFIDHAVQSASEYLETKKENIKIVYIGYMEVNNQPYVVYLFRDKDKIDYFAGFMRIEEEIILEPTQKIFYDLPDNVFGDKCWQNMYQKIKPEMYEALDLLIITYFLYGLRIDWTSLSNDEIVLVFNKANYYFLIQLGFDNFGVSIQEEGESNEIDTYNDFRIAVSKFLSDLTDDASIVPLIPVFNLRTQIDEYGKKWIAEVLIDKFKRN